MLQQSNEQQADAIEEVYLRFSLIYNKNQVRSLIALKNPTFVHCLFNIPHFIIMLPTQWKLQDQLQAQYENIATSYGKQNNKVYDENFNYHSYFQHLIKEISKNLDVVVHIAQTQKQIIEIIDKLKGKYKVILKLQNEETQEIQDKQIGKIEIFYPYEQLYMLNYRLIRLTHLHKIICYKKDIGKLKDFGSLDEGNSQNQDLTNEDQQWKEIKQAKLGNIVDENVIYSTNIFKTIKEQIASTYFDKITPNFISLTNQAGNAHILKFTISCMIQQGPYIDRKSLILKLDNLVRQIIPPSQINGLQQFLETYKNADYQRLKASKIISMYTDQTFLHRFVNKLLRASIDPFQLFYLTPVFLDIFNSIMDLYKQQQLTINQSKNHIQNQQQNKEFVCYRGAYFNQKQIELFTNSIGHVVECLGFLSTTEIQQKAIEMATNSLIIIKVPNEPRDEKTDYGYASISQYSQYYQQKEVLFNTLNSFKVQQVRPIQEMGTKKKKLYVIIMSYGIASEIVFKRKKRKNKIDQSTGTKSINKDIELSYQDRVYNLSQYQKFFSNNIGPRQGVLFYQRDSPIDLTRYWQKYIELAKEHYKRDHTKYIELSIAYKYYGQWCLRKNKFQLAQRSSYQNIELLKRQLGQTHLYYYSSLRSVCKVLLFSNREIQAHHLCVKINKYLNSIKTGDLLSIQDKESYFILYASHLYDITKINIESCKYRQNIEMLKIAQEKFETISREEEIQHVRVIFYSYVYEQLAINYHLLTEYSKALNYYTATLNILDISQNKSDMRHVQNLGKIAFIKLQTQNFDQSYKIFKECLRFRERELGRAHHSYLVNLLQLGQLLTQAERYQQSLIYYKEYKILNEQLKGSQENHQCAYVIGIIGSVYILIHLKDPIQNSLDIGMQLHKRSQQIFAKLYGRTSIEYAKAIAKHPNDYYLVGKLKQGIEVYETCLQIYENKKIEEISWYGEIMMSAAFYYLKLGNVDKSDDLSVKCLYINEQIYDKCSMQYSLTLWYLGMGQRILGHEELAFEYLKQSYKIVNALIQQPNSLALQSDKWYITSDGLKINRKANHIVCCLILNEIAQIYHNYGKYEDSITLFDQCIAIIDYLKKINKVSITELTLLKNIEQNKKKVEDTWRTIIFHLIESYPEQNKNNRPQKALQFDKQGQLKDYNRRQAQHNENENIIGMICYIDHIQS